MKNLAYKVSIVTILINLMLSILKIIAGILGNSTAMISDAIHSASDVLSTFVVIIGIYIAKRKPDKRHPYGHEKFECLGATVLSILLLITGISIGYSAINNIANNNVSVPSLIALIAAIISVVTKEWMYHYTMRAARKLNSTALKADAWHHRSDALSSVGSFVGILFAMLGFPIFDAIAGILIAICIIKVSIDILIDALDRILDTSAKEEVVEEIKDLAKIQEGVSNIDSLKTRLFGSKMYVDLEISVDGNLTLKEAHEIAENVHLTVENKFKDCKHCMVHVNPTKIEE